MDTTFDSDTAVQLIGERDAARRSLAANISADWRTARGPHGGYLAAIMLRALTQAVDQQNRRVRSLTVHFTRTPNPGRVQIETTVERQGRSLSTVSARMHQEEKLLALAVGAFSAPWRASPCSELSMPAVDPPDQTRSSPRPLREHLPPFAGHLVMQPRIGPMPPIDGQPEMQVGGWLGLCDARPVDALAVALFSDAWLPAPYVRMRRFVPVPTVDLTVHFRGELPREDPLELVLGCFRTKVIHDGFFEEDGVIWAPDGSVLAQSRQLAVIMQTDS
jgi:acyl-CoA thioesterase